MLCEKPFTVGGMAFGCGQCHFCRFNRRRIWAHRIMLESKCHPWSIFVTLTYDQANLPTSVCSSTGGVFPTLQRRHLTLFLKRLRKAIAPERIRYFACGEYGGRTDRPHYHLVLFGIRPCDRMRTLRHSLNGECLWRECCETCRLIGETWNMGIVEVGELNRKTASYTAEYVVKKMTRVDDDRLFGREPEFARMSRRPGLGYVALREVAEALPPMVDVPSGLRHGSSEYPLGRYLRGSLRELVGKEKRAPDETLSAMAEEMRPLQIAARSSSESFSKIVAEDGATRRAQITARNLIVKKERKL